MRVNLVKGLAKKIKDNKNNRNTLFMLDWIVTYLTGFHVVVSRSLKADCQPHSSPFTDGSPRPKIFWESVIVHPNPPTGRQVKTKHRLRKSLK